MAATPEVQTALVATPGRPSVYDALRVVEDSQRLVATGAAGTRLLESPDRDEAEKRRRMETEQQRFPPSFESWQRGQAEAGAQFLEGFESIMKQQLSMCEHALKLQEANAQQVQEVMRCMTRWMQRGEQPPADAGPPTVDATPKAEGSGGTGISVSMAETAAAQAPVEVASTLAPEVERHLKKTARKFEETLVKIERSSHSVDKAKVELDNLGEDSTHPRYPAGVRPHKAPTEFVELDAAWSGALQSSCVMSVEIPKGTSRRDAQGMLHHWFCRNLRLIALEASQDHVAKLTPLVSRKAFFAACASMDSEEMKDYGIEDGRRTTPNGKLALARAEQLYTEVVERVRQKRQNREEQEQKRKENEERKQKDMLKARPEETLQNLVTGIVAQTLEEQGLGVVAEEMVDTDAPGAEMLAGQFVEQVSGNGLSPGDVQGQNRKADSKSKGKGKSNLEDKGKGKTMEGGKSGTGNANGKSKGEGKADGKSSATAVAKAKAKPKPKPNRTAWQESGRGGSSNNSGNPWKQHQTFQQWSARGGWYYGRSDGNSGGRFGNWNNGGKGSKQGRW